MNYWGYRIDTNEKAREFFRKEIEKGVLRQGWGYEDSQDLTKTEIDKTARRNLPIFNKVKKDDYLLIPHLETWNEIMIVQATDDFCKGYKFDRNNEFGDYGHMFPVKLIKVFDRYNTEVGGDIRETFKCRSRFWNINRCEESINRLLNIADNSLLREKYSYAEMFKKRAKEALDEDTYADRLYALLNERTQASEWEYMLCEGFKQLLPDSYEVSTTSNRKENQHGADIIIRIPGILDTTYIIAIQVKDYEGIVGAEVIDQIDKSEEYYAESENNEVLIDKYVLITKAKEEINKELKEMAAKRNIKMIFGKDVKRLLVQMAKAFVGSAALE